MSNITLLKGSYKNTVKSNHLKYIFYVFSSKVSAIQGLFMKEFE